MVAAARIANKIGLAELALVERIETVLAAWKLPIVCPPYQADAIWEAMAHDKKKRGKALRWVLPREIGAVEIVEDVPQEIVQAVLKDMGAKSSI
jgi:3-dehydroquinate synthetase